MPNGVCVKAQLFLSERDLHTSTLMWLFVFTPTKLTSCKTEIVSFSNSYLTYNYISDFGCYLPYNYISDFGCTLMWLFVFTPTKLTSCKTETISFSNSYLPYNYISDFG
ncbi:hypothetical protein BaRGS_00031363, partial [Batillaria attramentaria]